MSLFIYLFIFLKKPFAISGFLCYTKRTRVGACNLFHKYRSIIGTGYDTAGDQKYHRLGNILLPYQTKNIVEPFPPRIALFYTALFLPNPFSIFEQLPRSSHQIITSVILSTMQVPVLVMKTQSGERQTWYFIHFYIPLLSDQVQFSDV